jgi:hypothetical protein
MEIVTLTKAARSFVLLWILFTAPSSSAEDKVDFSIVDRIQFTVPGEWKVIVSKSNATQTTFAFQIPNPADEGTPDSTNLALIAYNLNDPSANKAYAKKQSERGPGAKEAHLVDGWVCSTFQGMQDATTYSDWDCTRAVEKSGVFVRIAWPHLPKNPVDYDKIMETTMAEVLKSVVPYSTPSAQSSSGRGR